MEHADLAADLLRSVARINRWASRHAETDVPYAQARVLSLLEELGAIRIGDLAVADHSSQPTMTIQVQRLTERGWVSRTPDPNDARATRVELTEAGATVLDTVRAARNAAVLPLLDRLEEAERRCLASAGPVLERLLGLAVASDQAEAATAGDAATADDLGTPTVAPGSDPTPTRADRGPSTPGEPR